jgi:hypothetical protein
MDITDALAPVSDQLDAIELAAPRTFTIDTGSRLGIREGKAVAEIRLVDFPRVWRPSKGMLDVLAACWGTDGTQYVGRRVTVYNDPEVMFGKVKTGGVRISHLSHIDGPRNLTIRASGQGRTQQWHVDPLPDAQAPRTPPADRPTPEQMRTLGECFTEARITTGADKAGYIADVIGHPLSSWDDLSAADVEAVTVRLRTYSGAPADEPWAADAPEDGA